MNHNNSISRRHLLTANLGERRTTSVEVQQITFEPGQIGGLHLHPCPVMGYIISGTAVMEIEGQDERILKTGDAFYEPADTHIRQFSNYSDTRPVVFVAFYLLNGRQERLKYYN